MRLPAFPEYGFRLGELNGQRAIFCETRRRFVVLTPEEWVRQHSVRYLLEQAAMPKALLNVEKALRVNGLPKRYDAVVYKPDGSVFLLVECKAPEVEISQKTFDQIARYNLSLSAEYLLVTNGFRLLFCRLDHVAKRYVFLEQLPPFPKQP